ncbi:hypothetical protein [Ralstonia sp. A12]|uniref:hypothetical protein n=1 Tax=Ralstonia sp. A12 TaxID=1217052 RepID=UPI0012ED1A95|nr:hypothetical protein [Ralstonia sp. A12]
MTNTIARGMPLPPARSPGQAEGANANPLVDGGRKTRRAEGVLSTFPQRGDRSGKRPKIETSQPKAQPAMEGYFYQPFVGNGSVYSVAGDAMRRIANGKAPYPVIVANEADARAFQVQVEEVKREITGMRASASKPSKRTRKPAEQASKNAKQALMLNALESLQVLDAQTTGVLTKLQSDRSKLYIGGHGAPGAESVANLLADGSQVLLSAQALSMQLKGAGLPEDFKDIRSRACWSANRTRPHNFSRFEREFAGKPDLEARRGRQAPLAVHLLNALHADGFTQASVTGYHGMSVHLPSTFGQELHAAQRLGEGPVKRRSTLKERFTTPVALPAREPDGG